jgi:hypothetical protein
MLAWCGSVSREARRVPRDPRGRPSQGKRHRLLHVCVVLVEEHVGSLHGWVEEPDGACEGVSRTTVLPPSIMVKPAAQVCHTQGSDPQAPQGHATRRRGVAMYFPARIRAGVLRGCSRACESWYSCKTPRVPSATDEISTAARGENTRAPPLHVGFLFHTCGLPHTPSWKAADARQPHPLASRHLRRPSDTLCETVTGTITLSE